MRFILIIPLFFLWLTGFSQDLIVKKDGEKINCEIQSIDSVSIYFVRDSEKFGSQINKAEVESYYISDPYNVLDQQPDTSKNKSGEERLRLTVCIGGAKPTIEFGSKDLRDGQSGIAEPGIILGVNAEFKLSQVVSIKTRFHYQVNNVDQDLLQSNLTANAPAGSGLTVSASDWKIFGLFAGLHFSGPVIASKKLYLYFELVGGYPRFHSPEIISKSKKVVTENIQTAKTSVFAILPELGFRYYASNDLAINVGLAYLYAQPEFEDAKVVKANGSSVSGSFTQQISSVNIQLGISLLLY